VLIKERLNTNYIMQIRNTPTIVMEVRQTSARSCRNASKNSPRNDVNENKTALLSGHSKPLMCY